jgi:hypothetical protein
LAATRDFIQRRAQKIGRMLLRRGLVHGAVALRIGLLGVRQQLAKFARQLGTVDRCASDLGAQTLQRAGDRAQIGIGTPRAILVESFGDASQVGGRIRSLIATQGAVVGCIPRVARSRRGAAEHVGRNCLQQQRRHQQGRHRPRRARQPQADQRAHVSGSGTLFRIGKQCRSNRILRRV